MIVFTRIDHRLLHGQVAYAWTSFLSVDCILIANDNVVKDEFRKKAFKLAKPNDCKLIFKNIEDSVNAINSGVTDKYKLFIVVETVEDAYRLAMKCDQIKEINFGLSVKTDDSRSIAKAVYVNPTEEQQLKELLGKSIKIELKQGPRDSGTDLASVL